MNINTHHRYTITELHAGELQDLKFAIELALNADNGDIAKLTNCDLMALKDRWQKMANNLHDTLKKR